MPWNRYLEATVASNEVCSERKNWGALAAVVSTDRAESADGNGVAGTVAARARPGDALMVKPRIRAGRIRWLSDMIRPPGGASDDPGGSTSVRRPHGLSAGGRRP